MEYCIEEMIMVTGKRRRMHNEELNDLYWGMEEIA